MTRPALARTAACLAAVTPIVLGAALVPATGTPHPVRAGQVARVAPAGTPLEVTLETMTPSTIPRRGTVTLSGEVTNASDDTWTDVQAYLFVSGTPMTTGAELAEAATTDPAEEVGGRLAREGLFDEVGDLDPGETTSYTVTVRRQDLDSEISGEPGVYWVGVHVLGAVDGIRDVVADGRARSFMPLMADRGPRTEVAVVVPVRDLVRRSPDGRLLGLSRWQASVGPGGRLHRLSDFAGESEQPITWLVDPAVLDAVSSVANENPPLSTADDGSGPDEENGSSASPSPSPEADGEEGDGDESADEPTVAAQDAAAWLTSFVERTAGDTVLALPYGDVDVAAVSGNRLNRILRKAERLSARTLDALEVDGAPVVSPPSGLLPPRALARLDPDTPALLSDQALPDRTGPVVTRPDGTEVVLTDSAAATGGPGPNPRRDPLALRQRILAEASVRALTGERDRPLVVTTPQLWSLGGSWEGADFFDGLDLPWLSQVSLDSLLTKGDDEASEEPPVYPASERRRQVPFANQLATQELVDTGDLYAALLTRNDTVKDELAKAAMLASSYSVRARPGAALERARNTTLRVRRTMQLVDIDGPGFVMMSSETGPIGVSLVNNLSEPVTVRLEAITSRDDLEITAPDPITLAPGQRTPVRMRAESTAIGVHEVTLIATTEDGRRVGSQVQFNVRTSNVGAVVWLVMATGGALLLVMIVFRIQRRVRARRTQEGTE
ncbi:MAG: DUF6049 family protein [Nocardioides sp.]